jgi:hypothetical protein
VFGFLREVSGGMGSSRVRRRSGRPAIRAIEPLEDRRLLAAPGTLLGTTPVGPVLAVQGTPFGPVAVGNFQVAGSFTSADFAALVDFGDGTAPVPGTVVATPGTGNAPFPVVPGQNFTVSGGVGPDITLNAGLAVTRGQMVGPNNNPFTNLPQDQPVTFTAGTPYVPSGLSPPYNPNGSIGRLVSGDPTSNLIATLKPQGYEYDPTISGDGASTADQRRGEILVGYAPGVYIKANGLTGAFNSNPANAEIFIAETGSMEYLAVSLIGLDAGGNQHQTGFYFQMPMSYDKTGNGVGRAAYTAIDLDFTAPGSLGAAAQALGITQVTGIDIRAIRAGFYDPPFYNTAYDVIDANVSGTNQYGPVLRRGIDFLANSPDTGNPAVSGPAGTQGLPAFPDGSYAALDDPDIAFVAAAPGSLFTTAVTNVIVSAGDRFVDHGTFPGVTSLSLSNGGALVGTQDFQSNVAPLPLTYTVEPTVGAGVIVTGTLAVTNPVPAGYPNPLPQFYTATVDWGDGTTSDALVQDANGDGILEIVNDPNNPHVYTTPGTYNITIRLFTDGIPMSVFVSDTAGQIQVAATQPPTVTSVRRLGVHHQPTRIVVQFSEPLDPATASNVANYQLVTLIHGGRRVSAPFAFRSAVYDPTTNSVTLEPTRQLALRRAYQLTVNGTEPDGVRSSSGILLNGGSNSVVSFTGFGNGGGPVFRRQAGPVRPVARAHR